MLIGNAHSLLSLHKIGLLPRLQQASTSTPVTAKLSVCAGKLLRCSGIFFKDSVYVMGGVLSAACHKRKQRSSVGRTSPGQNEGIHKDLKPCTGNGISTGSGLRHRLVTDASPVDPGTVKEDSSSSSQERALIAICTPDDLPKDTTTSDTQTMELRDKPTSDVGENSDTGLAGRYVTDGREGMATGALEGADARASPLDGEGETAKEREDEGNNGVEMEVKKGEEDSVEVGVKEEVDGMETHVKEEEEEPRKWSFPPVLEEFNLMDSDVDPSELEETFADDRLVEVNFRVDPQGCGLGISIVGGTGSPTGDLPIVIKRILPLGLAARDGRLKAGDQLIAVNEWLLIGVSKNYALNALSNLEGHVRLLVLQDY